MWGAHLPPLQVETPEGRVLARLDRVLRPEVDKRPAARSPGIRVAAAQRGKSGRARASEMKQTRDAAIFAWAVDGADFLDRASLNRLKKAAPVAMRGGRAGFVTNGPDEDGYISVSWCGNDDAAESIETADLDEPFDEMPEEAWKALCDKHDADEAQGLDLAAFTKVLSEWPGGTDTIAKLYSQTPAWLVEVAPVIFAWAAGGADCLDHTSLNRLKKAVPVATQDGRAGVVTVGAPG